MVQLAVATNVETYERMQDPLAARDITVSHLETASRSVDLSQGKTAYTTDREFDVGFVFPPRLAEGGVAAALLDIPWVNSREHVLRSRQKGETLARLRKHQVPIPDTCVVSNPVTESQLREVFNRFEPPVVIKPNATTRGVGVAKAHDLDSFLGIVDYLDLVHDYRATGDQSFIVQEYLEGATDYRAMVVDGEYVGAVKRELSATDKAEGRWKHNVHRGATAQGVELPAALQRLAEEAADALSIPWLGVDLLATGDRTVVNETNARPTIDETTKYEDGFWDDVAALIRAQL